MEEQWDFFKENKISFENSKFVGHVMYVNQKIEHEVGNKLLLPGEEPTVFSSFTEEGTLLIGD